VISPQFHSIHKNPPGELHRNDNFLGRFEPLSIDCQEKVWGARKFKGMEKRRIVPGCQGPFVFELHQVGCTFGASVALSEVSLTIGSGERVALLGSSGAGKSTLLGILNGTHVPSAGTVRVLGQDLSHCAPRQLRRIQRQVGTVHQQHHLVSHLAVIHNVNAGQLGRWSLGKAVWSLLWPQETATAAEALAQVGIADKLYARTDRLSGGEQQRVAIARVLVQDPTVLLADEPIASVDPTRARDLMDRLRQLCRETGKTLVVSLHDVAFARSHCDRIIGLQRGRVQFDLPTAAVTTAHVEALYRL
jgi:phosphonate transport system ATP-binding protein